MKRSDFSYSLPPERIATHPAEPRDSARLLVANEPFTDTTIRTFPEWLREGDVLVLNDTRVIPARLYALRGTARIEILLNRPLEGGRWMVFAKPGKKLKAGDTLTIADGFTATVEAKDGYDVTLRFSETGDAFFSKLEQYGHMPLPPYIAREDTDADKADYQTIFARNAGAVAAPTAGLHFTPELLERIRARGVTITHVTLHVGAGTFLPVKADDVSDHKMHAEWCHLPAETAAAINTAKANGGRIVAVGTTSLRTLESAPWVEGHIQPFEGDTDIFITPGYRFKAVDVLLTNFHLPESTLLMLVSAFSGMERIRALYQHAIDNGYRFFSYGDACLLFRAP